MDQLKGISPTTLAETLKELQKEGIIRRESFAEIPPRVEYYLTEEGLELRKAVTPLLRWASSRSTAERQCVPRYREMPAHRVKE